MRPLIEDIESNFKPKKLVFIGFMSFGLKTDERMQDKPGFRSNCAIPNNCLNKY